MTPQRDPVLDRSEILGAMSQADVENLRVWWEKFNRGEIDLSLLDPDVVYEDANLPDHIREAYRGHDGVLRATKRWREPKSFCGTLAAKPVDVVVTLTAII